jgi:hypothetical protein
MKKLLIVVTVVAAMTASAQAATLNFDFSLVNNGGTLSPGATVTGVIELPLDCTTCAATAVIINSIPSGFSSGLANLTFPLDTTTAAASVGPNTFTVLAGELASEKYEAYTDNVFAFYLISSNPPYLLEDYSGHSVEAFPATFTPVGTTPLPAALPLFASGLGALGLFGWRRKRKAVALTAQFANRFGGDHRKLICEIMVDQGDLDGRGCAERRLAAILKNHRRQ